MTRFYRAGCLRLLNWDLTPQKMRADKDKVQIFVLLVCILLFMGIFALVFYQRMYANSSLLKGKVESLDTGYLYGFYVFGEPEIKDRSYYGSENASITIVAFMDVGQNSSKTFMSDIFPLLKREYIDTGKLRFYHKHYLTHDDVSGKSDRFIKA